MSKDFAYLKVKLPERQSSYIGYFIRKNPDGVGKHDIGVDFGGFSAHWSIINGLIARGVATIDGSTITLVEGEPTPLVAETMPKPYIKIKKVIVDVWCDSCITPTTKTVWLDPRGDGLFHITMPSEMKSVFYNKGDCRTGLGDNREFCAVGATFKQVITNAESLSREYQALMNSSIEDVLVISHACTIADKEKETSYHHDNTTSLGFAYYKCLLIGKNTLWAVDKKGRLCRLNYIGGIFESEGQREAFIKSHRSVVMRYTPEREAALAALNARLTAMATEFRRLISEEDIPTLLERSGHLLITSGGAE